MYMSCLNRVRVSFRTWIVNFTILLYHIFSAFSTDRPAASANFGLARSISRCQSALSVPRRACNAKLKCAPAVCPSIREFRLWNHLKDCSVVHPLNIGCTCTVGLPFFCLVSLVAIWPKVVFHHLDLLIFLPQGHMVLVPENMSLYIYLSPLCVLELGKCLIKGIVA
jgi:hypothetical protein